MAERMCLHREVEVVDRRLDPVDRHVGSVRTSRTVPCSDRPVANSRWMTVSCRSRAMRSRSSTSASSWSRACRRAFSMATPAAAARPTTSSSSTSVKTSAVVLSVRYRLPNTWSRTRIGTPRNERIGGWSGGKP